MCQNRRDIAPSPSSLSKLVQPPFDRRAQDQYTTAERPVHDGISVVTIGCPEVRTINLLHIPGTCDSPVPSSRRSPLTQTSCFNAQASITKHFLMPKLSYTSLSRDRESTPRPPLRVERLHGVANRQRVGWVDAHGLQENQCQYMCHPDRSCQRQVLTSMLLYPLNQNPTTNTKYVRMSELPLK